MSDEFDQASELEMMQNKIALDAQQEASKPDLAYQEGEDEFSCEECGCVVPVVRRKQTGSILCVDCKNWQDKDSGGRMKTFNIQPKEAIVRPYSGNYVDLYFDADVSDVADLLTVEEFVGCFSASDILEIIGIEAAKAHFGLVEEE